MKFVKELIERYPQLAVCKEDIDGVGKDWYT